MNNRIKITEEDLTSNVVTLDGDVDIVYIPGFADATVATAEPFVPTLCTSLSEFKTKFGSTPAKFADDQKYPVGSSDVKGFTAKAIPEPGNGENDTVWFEKLDPDASYIYACELLSKGLPIVYERINGGKIGEKVLDVTVEDFYLALTEHIFPLIPSESEIVNKDYRIKYITSGGYPVFEYGNVDASDTSTNVIVTAMKDIAAARGDCIALIDHTNNVKRDLVGEKSVFGTFTNIFKSVNDDSDTYVTMITPWCWTSLNGSNYAPVSGAYYLPGSFSYLSCLAASLKTNPSWLAISGVGRGLLSGIGWMGTTKKLTNAIADSYQLTSLDEGSSINAITYINGYGYCIWGNRTARANMFTKSTGFSTQFLNIRNLLCDVKKQVYLAAQSLLFEPNTEATWLTFTSLITPLLDRMVSGAGIKDYKIIQQSINDERTKISAVIKIYPVYAVEEFEIAIQVSDSDVTVE